MVLSILLVIKPKENIPIYNYTKLVKDEFKKIIDGHLNNEVILDDTSNSKLSHSYFDDNGQNFTSNELWNRFSPNNPKTYGYEKVYTISDRCELKWMNKIDGHFTIRYLDFNIEIGIDKNSMHLYHTEVSIIKNYFK